jgi:SM-20-related protein
LTVHHNPNIDPALIKQQYMLDKRVRLFPFLLQENADSILQSLDAETEFSSAFNIDGSNGVLTDAQMRNLAPADVQNLQENIYRNASEGCGFLYGRNNITGQHPDKGSPILSEFADMLNSEYVLSLIREISGHQDIRAASAQATRYLPGNFLTRHNDLHPDEGRRVAYVMNFTPEWHPDWGGLLQFYQQDGTPRDAWAPQFNTLALFDVEHVHAVTFVAPYARIPRLSITGWFRTRVL